MKNLLWFVFEHSLPSFILIYYQLHHIRSDLLNLSQELLLGALWERLEQEEQLWDAHANHLNEGVVVHPSAQGH